MTVILPVLIPHSLETRPMLHLNSPRRLNPTRRALLGAGVATLAMSLALSIAPAWAKNGNNGDDAPNGNGADSAGTVKLRDATTSDLVPETSNDPQVCAFSIVFEFSPATTGTWQIRSWPPTGDGSQVSAGAWDTTNGGSDETDVMTLSAGHYRLEYQAVDASNSRNKTFWVKDGCEAATGGTGGTGEQGDTGSGDQGQDEQPDTGSGDQGQDQQGDTGSGDQGQDEQGDTGNSGSQDEQGDTGNSGSQDEQGENGSGDQGGEGDVQGATGGQDNGHGGSQSSGNGPSTHPGNTDGGVQGVNAPAAGDGGATLPNTSTTPESVLSPLLAALGLLMLIGAHPFIRRSALADRA